MGKWYEFIPVEVEKVETENRRIQTAIPVPESELVQKVRDKFDVRTEKIIFLKADENLDYGDVLRVMDLVRG